MLGLQCNHCGALLEVAPKTRTATCVYCASPSVIERPATADRPNPSFALGFVVPPERALELTRKRVRRAFLAPRRFRRADVAAIRGVYVPAYLYTAAAYSSYRAKIGENYQVTETYETTDKDGEKVTRERTRTKTEWHRLGGEHAVYVNDHPVSASRGLPHHEMRTIEPFDLRALCRYTPKLISGWVAEEPALHPDACLAIARAEARKTIGRKLRAFMPGDHVLGLRHRTEFHDEHIELTLLPVWVLPIRYAADKPAVRLLVNGQNGRLGGRAPLSPVRVALALLAAVALIAAVVALLPNS